MPLKIPENLQSIVRLRADFLCEYCHTDERFQLVEFTIDHVVPVSAGGETGSENLALACFHCNRRKSDRQTIHDADTGVQVPIFNPRTMLWSDHFCWSTDGTEVIAQTDTGRVTVDLLGMNRERIIRVRAADVLVDRHPPKADPRDAAVKTPDRPDPAG